MEMLKLPVLIGSDISLDSTFHLAAVRFTSELIDFSTEVKPYVADDVQIVLSSFFLENGWRHQNLIGLPLLSVL